VVGSNTPGQREWVEFPRFFPHVSSCKPVLIGSFDPSRFTYSNSVKTIPRLLLAGLACGTLVCARDSFVSFGGQLPLSASVNGAVRYQDNVFLTPNKDADTLFMLTPALHLRQEGADLQVNASLAGQFLRYVDNTELNRNLPDASGTVNYNGARTQASLSASFAETDQSSTALRTFDQTLRQTETASALDASWSATAKTKASFGVAYSRTDYKEAVGVDQTTWTLPLNGYYSITPKVDLSAGYQYRRSRQAIALYNSSDHFLNVGARGDFTEKVKGDIRVGVNRRDQAQAGSEDGLGLGASLSYAYSPKTSFNAAISRDFRTSFLGESQEVFSIQMGGDFMISEIWQARAGLSWEDSTALGRGGRNDRFFTGEAEVSYVISRTATVSLAYYLRNSASDDEFYDFDSNIFSLSGMFRF